MDLLLGGAGHDKFRTFIATANDKAPVAQRGKAKQKRSDLRLAGCPDLTALPARVRSVADEDRFGGLTAYDTRRMITELTADQHRPTGAGLFSADPVRVDGCAWHAGEVTSPHNDVPGYRTMQMTAPWAPVAELAHLKVGAAAAGANHTPVARLLPGWLMFPRTTAF